ncbi:MAG: hypothetical protein QE265_05985 [Rhodoferax sp.]|nr:hypothetical protein [Rhodoferax sp.]
MSSFVNLLKSDVWSEADIVNRTESMISAQFAPHEVVILNRKVTAATIGAHTLTTAEQEELARYNQVCLDAAVAGVAARADMEVLHEVLRIEAGELDAAVSSERAAALYKLRNALPTEEPTVQ